MTVTYTQVVTETKGLGTFWKLLFRWRGSVYKLIWLDFLVYLCLYYILSFIYRFALNDTQKTSFEKVAMYCDSFAKFIPVSFVLGFYVSLVVGRWWAQYECLPWPDSLAVYVSTTIHGQDKRSRMMRRTIMRYTNLAFAMTLSLISPRIKKQFPTADHLIEAGILNPNEKIIIQNMAEKSGQPSYWMPLVWAGSIVSRARREGRIYDDFGVKTLLDEINGFRGRCGGLLSYDWISIPLVYTQVVTLAVYSFFLASLMGRQFLNPEKGYVGQSIDIYVPVFSLLQFFFYMGWLKVAETLVNPFGEDDDDFEVNWLIDRNLMLSYLIVDDLHNEYPDLLQDKYWDKAFPEMPHTKASKRFHIKGPEGSAANVVVEEKEKEIISTVIEEEEMELGTANPEVEKIEKKDGEREDDTFPPVNEATKDDLEVKQQLDGGGGGGGDADRMPSPGLGIEKTWE